MRGPKLNEGATVATLASGERHGTKATAKYVRSSATKARVVLDLVRGLDVRRADEVLQFTERGIATEIRKVLASAVANATNPDNTGSYIGDADELFVIACFADEGPTLRRFAPRARGRATRIRKRSCHITVVVARMSERRLAVVQARGEGISANAAASRRARVERSRVRAQAARAAATAPATGVHAPDAAEGEPIEDQTDDLVDEQTVDDESVETEVAEAIDAVHAQDAAEGEPVADEPVEPATEGGFTAGEWPGSVLPDEDGNGPETHLIKGNQDSMLYHDPESRYYKITKAEVWFDTAEHAEAAGFGKPASSTADEGDN